MYTLDIIIALPILYFGYKGAVNGLVKEILNIVGITLAVFLTFNYMDAFGSVIQPFFEDNPEYIPFASGAILFLGTLIIVAIIAFLAKKFLEAVKLGAVNRIFGALFGALKASMVVSAGLLLLSGFNFPAEQTREESLLYEYVVQVGPTTYEAIALIYPGAEGFTETIEQNISKYNPAENLPILKDK
jgi:membrane protein required for colicin V production